MKILTTNLDPQKAKEYIKECATFFATGDLTSEQADFLKTFNGPDNAVFTKNGYLLVWDEPENPELVDEDYLDTYHLVDPSGVVVFSYQETFGEIEITFGEPDWDRVNVRLADLDKE